MLRRLRKKLQRVEIWGWCPRATKENLKGAAYIDFEDFWNFLGSGCSQNEQSSIDWFSALPWPIWMIFDAFWSSVFILSFCDPFPRRSDVDFQISDVDLWIFLRMMIFQMIVSPGFGNGFGWFLVHFEASRSYFQLFGPFPRRSYVDFQISGVALWLFLIMIINFKWLYLFATGHRTLCYIHNKISTFSKFGDHKQWFQWCLVGGSAAWTEDWFDELSWLHEFTYLVIWETIM